jgi:TolB-like protein/DNA-binding winged helix-turn-helix (wHTH) protein/Tfp pilus assembly protein PilF
MEKSASSVPVATHEAPDRGPEPAEAFRFADWIAVPATGRLRQGGREVKLEPKVMDLLVYLATRPGKVVTRDELEAHVWAGTIVGYDTVTGAIQKLRKALGEDSHRPRIIETIPKRGYRLIAPVADWGLDRSPAPGKQQSSLAFNRLGKSMVPLGLALALALAVAILAGLWLMVGERSKPSHEPGWSTDAPLVGDPPSLAVLPLANLSVDDGHDYFSDGLTEDLTTDLAKIPGLTVAATSTAFAYRGSSAAPSELGQELGVRYLLVGSLRKDDDRLRLNARLVDTISGYALWADRFEGPLEEVFRLQDRITEQIVSALKDRLRLPEVDRPSLDNQYTPDPEAYDLYLRGTASLAQLSPENLRSARTRFEQAVQADARFARAYAALANTYSLEAGHWWSADPQTSLRRGLQSAQRAVELAPALPQARYALARVLRDMGDLGRAEKEINEAIRLDPGDADGYILRASILTYAGQAQKSLGQYDIARRLNLPRSARYLFHRGQTAFTLEDYRGAIRLFEQGLEQDPNSQRLRIWLAAAYAQSGRMEDAGWLIDEFVMAHPGIAAHDIATAVPYRQESDLQRLLAALRAAGFPE